jgi:hypothetical protein
VVVVTPIGLVLALSLSAFMFWLMPDKPVPVVLIPSAIVWLILTPLAEWRLYRRLKERSPGV